MESKPKDMKNYCFLISICFFLFACQGSNKSLNVNTEELKMADERGFYVKVGDKAPNFSAQLTDGRKIQLRDYRGVPVLLQFTASWCSVCRKEMPHIEKDIWLKHKENGLIVIGIDRDEPLDKVIQFAKSTGISYPLALDPGADIFGLYADKKSGVTRNILINKKGKIVMLTRLFNYEEFEKLKEMIDDLLK